MDTEPPNTRKAIIRGHGITPSRVDAYLPSNYEVDPYRSQDGDHVTIVGVDVAGWTLDGYVLPRLASGLMFGEEVTS